MKELDLVLNIVANFLTVIASGIAIYLFVTNASKIKSAINILLNYSNQIALNDLKYKIERLNDFNASDPIAKAEVINILHEIEGQINGSELLKIKLKIQLEKINVFTGNSKLLTEPKKRSIVSELRESVRNIDVSNYEALMNVKD